MFTHLKANWKKYALAAVGAAAAYYGIDPDTAKVLAVKVYETVLPAVQ